MRTGDDRDKEKKTKRKKRKSQERAGDASRGRSGPGSARDKKKRHRRRSPSDKSAKKEKKKHKARQRERGSSSAEREGLFGCFKCWAPEVHLLPRIGYDGRKADVWAAGVCSHELICGSYPFRGRSALEQQNGITLNEMRNKILTCPIKRDPD